MKPLTALGLLFSGASLGLLYRNKKNVHRHMLGQGCAALVALVGGVALLEYSGNLNVDFDLWLFPNAVMADDEAPYPGRPAPSAAYCLLLAGIALMTLDAKAVWLAPCMALQILLISLLALIGYIYDVSQLYHIGPYISTALHTAILLFILALGILSARPERYLAWLIGPFAGSIMAQKLLPIAVLFPFAIGLLQLKGLRSGWYGADFGLALFVTFHIVVFSVLSYGTAKFLNRSDAERETSFGALQESEERFRLLFEASPNGLLMADLEGKVKLANRQSETLFGYAANQLQGRKLETLLRDQAQELTYTYQEPFAVKLLSRAKKTEIEMVGLRRDGSKFIVQVKGGSLVTREGTMLLVTLVDITQRKLAEKDRNRFVALANASMEFIGMCDQDFKPFYVNPAGMRLVGLENIDAACAVRVQDYFFPEDQPFITHEFLPRVKKEGHGEIEIRLRHFQTGEAIWILYNVFNLRDENSHITGWATISRDITERKHMEEFLHRERSLLVSVMQATDFKLAFLDTRFNFVWVNPAYANTCKMKPEEMVGKNYFALYPDRENEAIFQHVRDSGEAVFYKDKPFVFPDQPERGTTYWDWSFTPVKESNGSVTGLVFSLRETTRFMKAQEALRESEERLNFALETSHTGAWELDLVDHTAHRSLEHDRIFGYDQLLPQWTYEMFLDHVLLEDRKAVDEAFLTAMATHSDWSFECRIRRADGEVRWIWAAGRHRKDNNEKPHHMVGIVQDITERKLAEEKILQINAELERRVSTRTLELESANARLKNELIERERAEAEVERFFTMSADLICIVDMEGNFRRVNAAFEATLGYSFSELAGRPILDFVHPDELETTRNEIEKLASAGLPSIRYENRYRCKDGFYKWLGWTMQPAPHGELYAMARDITERKLNEARITASLREKEVLLKEIHHRVKNNLQVIASLLRLQADNLSDPSARAPFLDSQQRVHAMALAHEHLYQSQGLASIHMAEYISSLVNSTRRTYNQSVAQINLRIEIAEIELDIEQAVPIGLIISELVSNSFKHAFTPPLANSPGELWVKLADQGLDGLMLEVGDNGRGIPDSVNVEKPFSMGLHLVHSFVLQLKGQLTVQRRPKTVFSIFIPKKK
ncbi:MAG: PAS domain S-box protein [Methylomicrobium sp.]